MFRLYVKPIFAIVVIFLVLSLITRALGSAQPPNAALRGFVEGCEGKLQPCWYGIVPGMTTWGDAHDIVGGLGYELAEERFIPGNQSIVIYASKTNLPCNMVYIFRNRETYTQYRLIETVELHHCDRLFVADVAHWYMDRQSIELHYTTASTTIRSIEDGLTFTFANALRPDAPVKVLVLNPFMSPQPAFAFRWQGFVPQWRYCQLLPHLTEC